MKDSYVFYMDKLQGAYLDTFKQIETYCGTQGMDAHTQEEKLMTLLDDFCMAQEQGKSVESIVGRDVERFCKNFCCDISWKHRLQHFLDYFYTMAKIDVVFCLLELVFDLADGKTPWQGESEMPMGSWLLAVLVVSVLSGVLNLAIAHWMFRIKGVPMKVQRFIFNGLPFILFFVLYMLIAGIELPIHCPTWVIFVICMVYIAAYRVGNRQRLRQEKKNKVSFWSLVERENDRELGDMLDKQLARKNARRARRGKPLISQAEFAAKLEKDCRMSQKLRWTYYVLPVVFTVGPLVASEFEGVIDMLLFAAIMLPMEVAIFRFFMKAEDSAQQSRMKWVEAHRGDTVTEREEEA